MKKLITIGPTERSGEIKAEMQNSNPGQGRKVVYPHKAADHSHGRVHKHAIGVNTGPGLFS